MGKQLAVVSALVIAVFACHPKEPGRGPDHPWATNNTFDDMLAELRSENVVRARVGAPPCAEGDFDRCNVACKAGNGWACTNAADADRSETKDRKFSLYQRACELHDPDGCTELAVMNLANFSHIAWDPYTLLYESCVQKSLRACKKGRAVLGAAASAAYDNQGEWRVLASYSTDMGHRACAMRDADECAAVGDWQVLCDRGVKNGCEMVAQNAEKDANLAREQARVAALTPEEREAESAAAAEDIRQSMAKYEAERLAREAAERKYDPNRDHPDATMIFLVPSECAYVVDQVCRTSMREEGAKLPPDLLEAAVTDCMAKPPLRKIYRTCMNIQCGPDFKRCMLHEAQGDYAKCAPLVERCGVRTE